MLSPKAHSNNYLFKSKLYPKMLMEPDLGGKTKKIYQLGCMFSGSSNASYDLPRMLPNSVHHLVTNFILLVLAVCRVNVQGNLCHLSL